MRYFFVITFRYTVINEKVSIVSINHSKSVVEMTLKNFLYSGYKFTNEEFELKTKIILINSMLSVGIISISVLTIFQFLDGKIVLASANSIFLFFNFIFLYLLRQSKVIYKRVVPFVALGAFLAVTIALVLFPGEQVRITWFLVVIIFAFFLGGKWLGISTTLMSVVAIVVIEKYVGLGLDSYTLFLAIAIILLGAIFVNQYEQRSTKARMMLMDINRDLEKKIKEGIRKRIELFQKNNQELLESAEKLEEQKAVFMHLAHYDTVTDLPNRVLFRDRLEHAIDKANRNSTKLALLFMDLDHFKEINDSLGHQVGDEVLKIVANRLQEKLRGSDSIARLGGDEFIVLIEDAKYDFEIVSIARKLAQSLKEPIAVKDHELYLSASIGISLYPNDGKDAETLLKYADAAMYSAKIDGRNTYHFFAKEMTEKALERVMVETGLRHALEKDEFVLYYQPQVNSKTGELEGLEALIRWNHPEMGIMTPGHFIPLAETTGLIIPMGEWVLRTAALQAVAWHEDGLNPTRISVNFSVKQLQHKNVIGMIKNILWESKCKPNWLELEITESYTMQNPNHSIALLERIRDIGLNIAIDDFGTGYSSFSYLKRLPINKLKIDKSFIDDVPGNKDDEVIVATIVSMAKSMQLDAVAEGVETDRQKVFLQQVGCDIIQGYLNYKPLSVDDMTKVLKEKKE